VIYHVLARDAGHPELGHRGRGMSEVRALPRHSSVGPHDLEPVLATGWLSSGAASSFEGAQAPPSPHLHPTIACAHCDSSLCQTRLHKSALHAGLFSHIVIGTMEQQVHDKPQVGPSSQQTVYIKLLPVLDSETILCVIHMIHNINIIQHQDCASCTAS